MKIENKLTLPANCAALTDDEMCYTSGGFGVAEAIGGIFATIIAAGLTVVGGVAAKGVLGIFSGTVGTAASGGSKLLSNAVDAIGSLF